MLFTRGSMARNLFVLQFSWPLSWPLGH